MSKRFIIVLPFIIALFTSASGQQKSPQKEDVVRLSVTLVQVDVTVTDRKGRQVRDLKPDDFEIYEDGRPQRISAFSYELTQPTSETAVTAEPQPPNNISPPALPPPPRAFRTNPGAVASLPPEKRWRRRCAGRPREASPRLYD